MTQGTIYKWTSNATMFLYYQLANGDVGQLHLGRAYKNGTVKLNLRPEAENYWGTLDEKVIAVSPELFTEGQKRLVVGFVFKGIKA